MIAATIGALKMSESGVRASLREIVLLLMPEG